MEYNLDDMKMIVAPSALIICILWDIALYVLRDYLDVKLPSWIPTNLFVLSALTIQILGYVDVQRVNVFGASNEKDVELMVDNQLKMDAARLTMCVFVGCLLPGMATVGNVGRWSNVAALFLTLCFHIATEIYALQNVNDSKVQSEAGPWFVSSGVVLLVGASSLLLLLGLVILNGKLWRDNMRPDDIDVSENQGIERKTLKSEPMKSWVAVRAWKTFYFVSSSAFSPGAGVIVTSCVAVMAAKVVCRSSLLHGGGNLTFYLQCIFILVGWILMLCRWFKGSLYSGSGIYGYVIFVMVIMTVRAVIVVHCPRLANIFKNPRDFSIREFKWGDVLISLTLAVLVLPLSALILASSLLLLFSFICGLFSSLVFSTNYVQRLFKLDKKAISVKDLCSEYESTLLEDMNFDEANQRTFWMLSKELYDRMKGRVDGAHQKAESCTALHSIMGNSGLDQNQRLRRVCRKYSWMTIMSSIFGVIADIGVEMEDAFEAYKETKDVLKFVDCPENIVVDLLSIFNTLNITGFIDSITNEEKMFYLERESKQGKRHLQEHTPEVLVTELNIFGEMFFNSPLISMDAAPSVEELRKLVGRVIVSSLLEAPDLMVKYTKQWAHSLDEGKIEGAVELTGKVSGLLEKLVKERDLHLSTETGEVPSEREEGGIELERPA